MFVSVIKPRPDLQFGTTKSQVYGNLTFRKEPTKPPTARGLVRSITVSNSTAISGLLLVTGKWSTFWLDNYVIQHTRIGCWVLHKGRVHKMFFGHWLKNKKGGGVQDTTNKAPNPPPSHDFFSVKLTHLTDLTHLTHLIHLNNPTIWHIWPMYYFFFLLLFVILEQT